MALDYIQIVGSGTKLIITSAIPPLLFFDNDSALNKGVEFLSNIDLSPATINAEIFGGITTVFSGIWDWLVYNLLSPFIILVFIALFFLGQYLIFKMYVFIFTNIFKTVKDAYFWIMNNTKFQNLLKLWENAFR